MQGAGSTGCTVDSKTCPDVVAHGKTEAAADIFPIEPYRLFEQGQFTYALCGQAGWRRQDEAWPVVDFEPRTGQKDVLRAATDIDTKDRTCFL